MVFPSKDKPRETIWICPKSENTDASEEDDVEEFNCKESLFLLYDVNSGPPLTKGGVMEVVGTIVSGYKGTTFKISGHDRARSFSYHPTVSVIKVAQVGDSEWEPNFSIN